LEYVGIFAWSLFHPLAHWGNHLLFLNGPIFPSTVLSTTSRATPEASLLSTPFRLLNSSEAFGPHYHRLFLIQRRIRIENINTTRPHTHTHFHRVWGGFMNSLGIGCGGHLMTNRFLPRGDGTHFDVHRQAHAIGVFASKFFFCLYGTYL
jgi:hypothetical protein